MNITRRLDRLLVFVFLPNTFLMIQIDCIFQIISLIQGLNIDKEVAKRSITIHFSASFTLLYVKKTTYNT